jgi:PPE-repeat protein
MLWHAMPPELNTARLMAGAGPAPMLQAAAGWEAVAAALETQAAELAASLASLKAVWTGASSDRAIAAAMPMVTWLQTAAQLAQKRGMQAAAQAAAYVKALAMTPSLPEIAVNHITHTVLTATNFFGINTMPIGFNETDYFVRMWNQAGGAMDIYAAETMANTVFEPLPAMKPIVAPGVGEAMAAEAMGAFSAMGSETSSATALRALAAAADDTDGVLPDPSAVGVDQFSQIMQGLGQLGGPMQQLTQPLQQMMSSLSSQAGSMGGSTGLGGDLLAGGKLGDAAGKGTQLGMVGAPPLSSHPLTGGSGPSIGMGLMHSEALPGQGGTSPRTSMMSSLIDKPAAAGAPAGAVAGAGSSATGGAAPMGAMGQGGQSAGGARQGLSAPVALAEQNQDELVHDELVDEGDDW